MKPTTLRWTVRCFGVLVICISLLPHGLAAFTYGDFSSIAGLDLVGDATQMGSAIRLTPAAGGKKGAVWYGQKLYCANGFTTRFSFRITGRGGIANGGDGISFSIQNGSATALGTEYGAETNAASPNMLGVSLNTFWNPGLEPSGNFVAVNTNGPNYLALRNLDGTPIALNDGNMHNVEIQCSSGFISVTIDGFVALTNSPVPPLQGLDDNGYCWVGFGARTGGAWENHDILNWSFNRAPIAHCADLVVPPCSANTSVDNGSFDPDGDLIQVAQSPPGPYPEGTNLVTLTVTDDKAASSSCSARVIMLAAAATLNYTNFSSTNGLNLVGTSSVVGGALRLTPAAEGVSGTAWAIAKQPCAGGFNTRFRFRMSNLGGRPGVPPGGDGILFSIQKNGPTDPLVHGLLSPADGTVSVFLNSFWNWPDGTDFTRWDISGNSVGVLSNALYLGQTDLTPRGINLEDGAVHEARIAYNGFGLTVWLDETLVLTNVAVPGMASAVDAAGNAWVGFGAGTGWAWADYDILSWSYASTSCNHPPVAQGKDVFVTAGAQCTAEGNIDNGSFDPDGDPITLSQSPEGPYSIGTNVVTLTVADSKGASSSCAALVVVLDKTPPTLVSALDKQVTCGAAWDFGTPAATDNCGATLLSIVETVTNSTCGGSFTATRTWQATDGGGNAVTCTQTVTVVDMTPPTITCPVSPTLEFQDETGTAASYVVKASDLCSAFNLVVTPPSGTRFPIGATKVEAMTTDSCGNGNRCSFVVNVLGAQGVKSNVLAELVALRAGSADGAGEKLDGAIAHLAKSLTPDYWIDQTHLQFKSGNTAINEEKLAAKGLADAMESKTIPYSAPVLQGFIDRIVKCDRLLAVVSVQEAAAAGLPPKKVEQDLAMIDKGDREAERGHYPNAIEHYRNAWRHALQLRVQVTVAAADGTWLQFIGDPSKNYLLEVSTDTVNWTPLGTCKANAEGDAEFVDTRNTAEPTRFYRVVEQ